MTRTEKELGDFYDFLYHDTEGWVYSPTIDGTGKISRYMFEWPKERSDLILHAVESSAQGIDVYMSPALFKEKAEGGLKTNVKGSWVLWADFDGNAPSQFDGRIPEPSVRVQSSVPGREHVYWALDSFQNEVSTIEARNRSIAYSFNADTGGWDAAQFLRPPGTINTGRNKSNREHVVVKRLTAYGDGLALAGFDGLPTPREVVTAEVLGNVPPWNEVLTLNKWTPSMLALFEEDAAKLTAEHRRSDAMMSLGYQAAEAGFTDGAIFCLLDRVDKKWGKYAKREHRDTLLIKMVSQIRAKVGYLKGDEFEALEKSLFESKDEEPQTKIKTLYSFKSFVEAEFNFDWIVDGLVTRGGWGIFTGSPGVGKTQLAMQMARDLALGRDFLAWKNEQERKVMFLSLEMNAPSLQKFLRAMALSHAPDELEVLGKNLAIVPTGAPIPLGEERGQRLLDLLMQSEQPEVLIIDSLQKVFTGEITGLQETRDFNNYMAERIRKRYECAVIAIHHNKKSATKHVSSDLDEAYGNTFLTADLDFAVNMRRPPDSDIIFVDQTKARLSAEQPSFAVRRTEYLGYEITDTDRPRERVEISPDDDFTFGDFG